MNTNYTIIEEHATVRQIIAFAAAGLALAVITVICAIQWARAQSDYAILGFSMLTFSTGFLAGVILRGVILEVADQIKGI